MVSCGQEEDIGIVPHFFLTVSEFVSAPATSKPILWESRSHISSVAKHMHKLHGNL